MGGSSLDSRTNEVAFWYSDYGCLPNMRPIHPCRQAAVVFDMDGVLLHSFEAWLATCLEADRRFGRGTLTREAFLPTFGQGTDADLRVFGWRATREAVDAFYAAELPRHRDLVQADPDAAGALDALRALDLRLAVATNTMRPLAEALLAGAGLLARLDAVACADEVRAGKPAPDVVLLACERLGVAPAEARFVGDSSYDHEAGVRAGVRFVGYRQDGDERVETLPALVALLEPAR